MAGYYRRGGSSPETDINILLLGETGVGKTTFVNALVNCLFYDTLDDALKGDVKCLIPSSFTLTEGQTFDETTVIIGNQDKNENFKNDGASSTQLCRSYIFPIGQRLLRLIDAPGVGDTRGGDYDAINFEHILNYISQYEHLNGICILFKPAVTRLNIYFRYCVKELLRHLHVNAKDNIMFVFTNSRTTFYRPGETTSLLKALLKDLREKTAAYKQGSTFLIKDIENYRQSWDKSVQEFSRLITCICQCDLHAIQDMQSLNEAQLLIHKLSRPIGEIITLIQENIQMAQQYKQKLLNNPAKDLSNRIPQKTGKFIPLRERLTVCVNEKCTEVVTVNGEQTIDYKSNCHVGCSLHRVVQECIGHPIIRKCRALRKTGSCRQCGCHWTKHMHITYKYERNLTYVPLDNDQNLNSASSSSTPQSVMLLIDKRISDLRKEERAIRDICVKLVQFLKKYSITSYNDDILEYLQHFIREEQQKQREGKDNGEIIRGLQQMVKDYTDEVNLIKTTKTENFADTLEIEQIFTLVGKLYELPINGKLIEEQINQMKVGRTQATTADQYVELPTGRNSPSILRNLQQVINQKKR